MKKCKVIKYFLFVFIFLVTNKTSGQDINSVIYKHFELDEAVEITDETYSLPDVVKTPVAYNTDSLDLFTENAKKAFPSGDYNAVFSNYMKIYAMAVEAKDSLYIARMYNNVGVVNHLSGNYENAVKHYHKKLIVLQQMGVKEERNIVKTLLNIGSEYSDLGINKVAIGYYDIVISLEDKYPILALKAINEKAIYEEVSGRYKSAMKLYRKALKIAEFEKDTTELLRVYNNVGTLYFEQKNIKKSLEIYEEALKFCKSTSNDVYFELEANRLNCLYELKQYDLVEDLVAHFINTAKAQNNVYFHAVGLETKGNIYHSRHQFHKAIATYEEAYQLYEILHLTDFASLVHVQLANSYTKIGAYSKAINNIQKALIIQERYGRIRELKDSYIALSYAYELNKQPEKALQQLKKANTIRDSIYKADITTEVMVIEERYQSEKKDAEIAMLKKDQEFQYLQIEKQESRNQLFLLILVLLVLLGYMLYLFLKSKSEKNEALLLKHKLQVEQRLLRVQMNPHFMFNSLNSIQGYVSENDSWHAEVYLSKFASLMRTTLEYSQREWVYLSEDIKNLNLYVALEQLRFQNQFDYNYEIDFDIDDELMVPPMLLQPFVENAILHGLAPVKEGGKLQLYVHMKDECIEAIISDNGIGRVAASALKKGKHHRSMGVELTQKRIEILDEQINDAVIYSDPETGSGTIVRILIPVKNP